MIRLDGVQCRNCETIVSVRTEYGSLQVNCQSCGSDIRREVRQVVLEMNGCDWLNELIDGGFLVGE